MTLPILPPEIWFWVLALAQQPRCRPLSKPPRSALRQDTLTRASRVCRLFDEICTPLIYKEVTTDDLPTLLVRCYAPTMKHRLSFTKSLFIEYSPREDPTYFSVLKSGGDHWDNFAGTEMDGIDRSEVEVTMFAAALKERSGIKEFLPNLETAAVSSIYGRGPVWEDYELHHQKRNTESSAHFSLSFFDHYLSSGNLRQLCVRDLNGPLGMLDLSCATDALAQPSGHFPRVVHFPKVDDLTRLPLRMGSVVRWVSDSNPDEEWADILIQILEIVVELCDGRSERQEKHYQEDTVDLHIYCSTARFTPETFFARLDDLDLQGVDFGLPFTKFGTFDETCHTLSEEEQRGMTRLLGALLEKFFRQRSGLEDKVRWFPSSAIPICASCGSGVPE